MMNINKNVSHNLPPQKDSAILDMADGPLCRLIMERTGIKIYPHQIEGLHKTITAACQRFGFSDREALIQALLSKPGLSPEMEFLVSNITVGESYFFRDEAQMTLLQDHLLPEIIARKRKAQDLSLRLWSAGCSSGQEIFTVAILLNELIPDLGLWKLHLLATDINTDVLASAVKGTYRDWSFRTIPPSIKQTYFTQVGDEYVLNEKIRHGVKFSYLNLADDVYPALLTETYSMDLMALLKIKWVATVN